LVLGWFGGYGIGAAMQSLTGNLYLPPLAALVLLTEFCGPPLLVLGLFTRVAALTRPSRSASEAVNCRPHLAVRVGERAQRAQD
jgi:hypothetical protein